MKKNDDHLQLPVTSKQILSFFISAIPVIAVGGYLYAEFENRLELIESSMAENKTNLTKIGTIGSICVFVIPIIVSVVMRLL